MTSQFRERAKQIHPMFLSEYWEYPQPDRKWFKALAQFSEAITVNLIHLPHYVRSLNHTTIETLYMTVHIHTTWNKL